jgi:hypothetical protein
MSSLFLKQKKIVALLPPVPKVVDFPPKPEASSEEEKKYATSMAMKEKVLVDASKNPTKYKWNIPLLQVPCFFKKLA